MSGSAQSTGGRLKGTGKLSGRLGTRLLVNLLLTSFLALNLAAQENSRRNPSDSAFSPELIRQLITIRDAALADDYAFRQVAHLTENIGPRPSGSAQAQQAAQYVADEMRKLGLEVRLEEVKVPHWVRGAETAELVEFPGQAPRTSQKIVVTALGGSTATAGRRV